MKSLHVAITLCILLQGCLSLLKDSSEILKDILQKADPNALPSVGDEPLNLNVHFSLINVLRAVVDHNEAEVIVWLVLQWKDPSLSWSREVTSVRQVVAPSARVWIPDIVFFNSVAAPEIYSNAWVKIQHNGDVLHAYQARVRIACDLPPKSLQGPITCYLRAGSWTRSTREITLTHHEGDTLANFSPASEFAMVNATQTVNVKAYPCCPDSDKFAEIEFAFTFKKKVI